jgi:hypothetical protein
MRNSQRIRTCLLPPAAADRAFSSSYSLVYASALAASFSLLSCSFFSAVCRSCFLYNKDEAGKDRSG